MLITQLFGDYAINIRIPIKQPVSYGKYPAGYFRSAQLSIMPIAWTLRKSAKKKKHHKDKAAREMFRKSCSVLLMGETMFFCSGFS